MKTLAQKSIVVLYDGACPTCIKDRHLYEKFAGFNNELIQWRDFNNHGALLVEFEISPLDAMYELHLIIDNQVVVKEIDAYIVLLKHITWLKPLAWFIQVPLIKRPLSKYYRYRVQKRLTRTGRI